LTSQVIKHKLPLRIVQNCHITLNNVVVDESQKLPKATDFAKGTNAILKHSRILVCWIAAGLCLGVYDNAIKFVSERRQFDRPISGILLFISRIPIDPRKDGQDHGQHSGCLFDVLQTF
jgi:alkylation response protein AidB-like acyl-CoA dehydrogenase